jgi:hypothetical protein
MVAVVIFGIALVVTLLFVVGHISLMWAWPAIGIVIAVLIGYRMRQNSGPTPPA